MLEQLIKIAISIFVIFVIVKFSNFVDKLKSSNRFDILFGTMILIISICACTLFCQIFAIFSGLMKSLFNSFSINW